MSILEKIIAYKKTFVELSKKERPAGLLERLATFSLSPISFSAHLRNKEKAGIIAEIKRSSPSAGAINTNVDVEKISQAYTEAGAAALSVLTDEKFFGGSYKDIEIARKNTICPILRKDFIIDEYQILEAKSIGADCILLIAACLDAKDCKSLAQFAKSLELEVLLEVRTKEEIDSHFNAYIDIIGVNNRNLVDFKTDITNSIHLAEFLPKEIIRISESGIRHASDIQKLKSHGYDGFLIGGFFMEHDNPGFACKTLIDNYKSLAL